MYVFAPSNNARRWFTTSDKPQYEILHNDVDWNLYRPKTRELSPRDVREVFLTSSYKKAMHVPPSVKKKKKKKRVSLVCCKRVVVGGHLGSPRLIRE